MYANSDKENKYIREVASSLDPTAEAILKNLTSDLTDASYEPLNGLLTNGLHQLILDYEGGNGFMNSVKSQAHKGRALSIKQYRAVANIVRKALRDEVQDIGHGFAPAPSGSPAPLPPPVATPSPTPTPTANTFSGYKCYVCGQHFPNMQDVLNHKRAEHGTARTASHRPPPARTTPKLNLDVRTGLPHDKCRFAVDLGSHLPEKERYLYFIKTTMRKRMKLNGRFQWTKYPDRRYQYVEVGDVVLRKQIGDTKEFIGCQLTSDNVYYGEYEDEIAKAIADPQAAMLLYGQRMKLCCFCGRSLTDAESQKMGMGPDCFEQYYVPTLTKHLGRSL